MEPQLIVLIVRHTSSGGYVPVVPDDEQVGDGHRHRRPDGDGFHLRPQFT